MWCLPSMGEFRFVGGICILCMISYSLLHLFLGAFRVFGFICISGAHHGEFTWRIDALKHEIPTPRISPALGYRYLAFFNLDIKHTLVSAASHEGVYHRNLISTSYLHNSNFSRDSATVICVIILARVFPTCLEPVIMVAEEMMMW